MSETHYLKTQPQFFFAVRRGDKNFEVRKDDRAYQAGDTLVLEYFDHKRPPNQPQDYYEPVTRTVTFVLPGGQFGIEVGYVVMGLSTPPHREGE